MPKKYSSKRKSPFGKALVLLIGFIFALVIIRIVTQTDMIGQIIRAFEMSGSRYDDLVEFDQDERDSTLKKIAGFWTYSSKKKEPFAVTDRIELKDNGYIWRVETVNYTLPSGAKKEIVHAANEFFYPSSGSAGEAANLNCVIRTFQQLWINDGDTCVVLNYAGRASEKLVADIIVVDFIDKVYDIYADGTTLNIYDRQFTKYTGPDVSSFFPEGVVDIIYDLTTSTLSKNKTGYAVKDKSVEIKDGKAAKGDTLLVDTPLAKCPDTYTLASLILESVNEDLQSTVVSARDHDALVEVIKTYHLRYCFDHEIIAGLDGKQKAPKIKFSFDINWKGETENISVLISGKALNKKWIEDNLTLEIEKWRFQRLEKESVPFNVTFVNTFEQ